jgi:chromosomal replication initiation ATPase DnaA
MSPGHIAELVRLYYRAMREERERERRRTYDLDPVARAILEATAEEMGVTRADLRRRGRQRPLVRARWVAMRVLRDEGYSSPAIGRHLRRDHATVLQALDRVAADAELVEIADRIRTSSRVQARRAAA